MENKNIFANNLKYYMEASGKTRRDVCNDLGFNYYTFTSWVNGSKYPRMDKVEALANYFGIMKSDLIEENSRPAPTTESGADKEFIELFQHLSPEEKKMLMAQMRGLLDNQ